MDEPSNAELGRRLEYITQMLQSLVSRGEYTADQRLSEHRFTEVERDVADLRRQHEKDVDGIHAQMVKDRDAKSTNWRTTISGVVIPILATLISLLGAFLIALWSVKG